jgi:hypothetical protein
VRSVYKAKEQFDQLTAQAKEAMDRAMKNLEAEGADAKASPVLSSESETDGSPSLIDLARRLNVPTEGRTAEKIVDSIASHAVHTAQPS